MKPGEVEALRHRVMEIDLDTRHLEEAGYDGILVHFNAIIVHANDAFARLIECEPHEVVGLNSFELYPPQSLRTILQKLDEQCEEPYQVTGLTRKSNEIEVGLWPQNFRMDGRVGRLIGTKRIDP